MALEAAQHTLRELKPAEQLVRDDELPLVIGLAHQRRLVRPSEMLEQRLL